MDDQNPFCCAFVDQGAAKVSHREDRNHAAIPFGLDNELPTSYRIRVEAYSIHAPIATGAGNLSLS
jgi:hypothetical protein